MTTDKGQRKPLTDAQRRALAILEEYGPLMPGRFAERMWPDAEGWQRLGKCGNKGSTRGVGMRLAGGGFLGKLWKLGLVHPVWRFDCREYRLSDGGYSALRTGFRREC